MTTTCHCGTVIIDASERCKVSSNTVRSLVHILIRLLGEQYRGEKTEWLVQKRLYMEVSLSVCSAEVTEARNGQKCVVNKHTRFAVARRQGAKTFLRLETPELLFLAWASGFHIHSPVCRQKTQLIHWTLPFLSFHKYEIGFDKITF